MGPTELALDFYLTLVTLLLNVDLCDFPLVSDSDYLERDCPEAIVSSTSTAGPYEYVSSILLLLATYRNYPIGVTGD